MSGHLQKMSLRLTYMQEVKRPWASLLRQDKFNKVNYYMIGQKISYITSAKFVPHPNKNSFWGYLRFSGQQKHQIN